MPGRRHSWVTLGLLLAAYPRLRGRIGPGSVDPVGLFEMSREELEKAHALRPMEAQAIFSGVFAARARKEIASCREKGIAIVTFADTAYPARLRGLPDPPAFLYTRGRVAQEDEDAVAIVGSRKATPYGLHVAGVLGREMARAGVTVVSGLARGIDTAAHDGALEGGGRTIGILGSGIDVIYPKENARLCDRVASSGAVLTELPMGAPPLPRHFPVRNRVIAAMSSAVVVVEAARRSGSLITARVGGDEMGLPVAAVPGPITSETSAGCNDLLYDGATPVREARDILDLLPRESRNRLATRAERDDGSPVPEDLAAGPRRILEALGPGAASSADGLASATGLASAVLLGHLLELEMRGLVRQLPGGLYTRKVRGSRS